MNWLNWLLPRWYIEARDLFVAWNRECWEEVEKCKAITATMPQPLVQGKEPFL